MSLLCKSLKHYDLFLDQLALKLGQLLSESTVGADVLPLRLHEVLGRLEPRSSFPHEVGDGKAGASGDACRAVDQDLPALALHFLHPVVVVLEVLLDGLLGEVIDFVQLVLVLGVAFEWLVEM